MPALPLGVSHYVRTVGKTPPILLLNMYLEKDPSNLIDGLARLQRPALTPFATLSGASRGVYRQAGTFGGDYLAVSGASLYRVTTGGSATLLGSISGSGPVIMAASATRALIATGGTCYSTVGATVTTVAMPDGVSVSSVAYMNGYFILTVTDSQRYYWIAPGETDPDALSFASAENSPDNIEVCRRLLDELWFLGSASLEIWQATGNADAPFSRIGGRLYERGCLNRHTACVLDNTIFWVGENKQVYRADGGPVRISDHGIEERLRACDAADLSAWVFSLDGHTFYVLRVGDEGTFVYDVENSNWLHWFSYGAETWRANSGAQSDSQIVVGDDATGALWVLDQERNNDNGDPLVRQIRGGVAVLGKPVVCDSVRVYCATGGAEIDQEINIEINFFDDGGFALTGPWLQMSLGNQGDYGFEVVARQLGLIYPPGRLFDIRMTDDAPFRVSYARMNED